jgi:hypothetical protein
VLIGDLLKELVHSNSGSRRMFQARTCAHPEATRLPTATAAMQQSSLFENPLSSCTVLSAIWMLLLVKQRASSQAVAMLHRHASLCAQFDAILARQEQGLYTCCTPCLWHAHVS